MFSLKILELDHVDQERPEKSGVWATAPLRKADSAQPLPTRARIDALHVTKMRHEKGRGLIRPAPLCSENRRSLSFDQPMDRAVTVLAARRYVRCYGALPVRSLRWRAGRSPFASGAGRQLAGRAPVLAAPA